MDETDPGIEIPDDLYIALVEQADANQRTPIEELRVILTAAIEQASDDAP